MSGRNPKGYEMMGGLQSRASEPNSSALSDWIPVAARRPWAVRTHSSHGGGQHVHDLTASTRTWYSSACAKAAGCPVLKDSKCMLAGFVANNRGHDGHWCEKLEDEDTLPRERDQQLAPLGR
jgi:hypothetical protein